MDGDFRSFHGSVVPHLRVSVSIGDHRKEISQSSVPPDQPGVGQRSGSSACHETFTFTTGDATVGSCDSDRRDASDDKKALSSQGSFHRDSTRTRPNERFTSRSKIDPSRSTGECPARGLRPSDACLRPRMT